VLTLGLETDLIDHISQSQKQKIVLWIADKILEQAIIDTAGDASVGVLALTPAHLSQVLPRLTTILTTEVGTSSRVRLVVDCLNPKDILKCLQKFKAERFVHTPSCSPPGAYPPS
jgi:hypothetical protein